MRRLADVPLLQVPDDFAVTADELRAAEWAVADPNDIDWTLVVALRRTASDEIAREVEAHAARSGAPLTADDRRLLGRRVLRSTVQRHAEERSLAGELWSREREHAYALALEDAIFGYGRLQPLFEVEGAENVEIHGHDSVVVQYGDGRRQPHPPVADSDEELIEAVRFLGESVRPARPFDDAHASVTIPLGNRFRLHAMGFGVTYRPSITIRRHNLTDVDLPELVRRGMMPEDLGRLLHAAVLGRKSLVIAGDQGAGKTTLLRALIAAIPDNERFGTIETDYELFTHLRPNRRNILALQSRVGLGELQDGRTLGEYTVADLIPEALRQNLSRLIVGEVRGAEAGAMFEAMQSGTGTMSTTHSHSAESTMDRLAARVAQGGVLSMDEAFRQIAHHIGLLIHVQLTDDTWRGGVRTRRVFEVRHLTGALEGNRPVTHVVYRAATPQTPEVFHPDAALLAELGPFFDDTRWR